MARTRQEQLFQIEFDQYYRYGAVALLLKPLLSHLHRPAHILEVGCNTLNCLEGFLDPCRVSITRADVEEHPDHANPFLHIPRDGPIPCGDQSFDYVIALEVLEHIPREDRPFMVGEWARVASKGVILSCPNNRPSVRRAERRIDQAHRRKHGRLHPWLREHQLYGIPSKAEVRAIFEKLGLAAHAFGNAPLAEWLPLLLISEELQAVGSAELSATFHHLLNMRSFRAFAKERPYRQIFCAFRNEDQARKAVHLWRQHGITDAIKETEIVDPMQLLTQQLRDLFQSHPDVGPWLAGQQRDQRLIKQLRAEVEGLQRELAWSRWHAQAPGRVRRFWQCLRWPWHSRCMSLKEAETFHLVPAPQAGVGVWESLSLDPQFVWQVHGWHGWHRIRLWGRGPLQDQVKVYVDYGHGFDEEHMIPLGTWSASGSLEQYAYFHHPVRRIRLDPMTDRQLCRIDRFDIQPCSLMRCLMAGWKRSFQDWFNGESRAFAWKLLLTRHGWRQMLKRWLNRSTQLSPAQKHSTLLPPPKYADWCSARQWSAVESEQRIGRIRTQSNLPQLIFSISIPRRVRAVDLQRTLHSLACQTNRLSWQLVLTVNACFLNEIQTLLAGMHWPDDRLLLLPMPPGVECEADHLNHMLCQTKGTHIIPVHVGDQINRDTVIHIHEALMQHPQADLIYSDEDHWSEDKGRHHPRMKPDWSPDYYRACPYIGRLAVYNKSTLQQINGFDSAFEGGHEIDVILRLSANPSMQIVHWPHVLYHRSANSEASLVPPMRAAEVVQHHLERGTAGLFGQVERSLDGYKVQLAIQGDPRVSIIIPTAGKQARIHGEVKAHIVHLLDSLKSRTDYKQYEIILVDNGPLPTATEKALASFELKRTRRFAPFNFSANLNWAVREAQGDQLLFLNDDMEIIHNDWLEQLLRYATQPGIGVVGAKLLFPNGCIQHAGVHLFDPGPGHPYYGSQGSERGYLDCVVTPRNLLAVTGACLMTSRCTFEQVGGFDESFPLNYNDVDYCFKVHQSGLRIVYHPGVELYHFERMRRDSHENLSAWELKQFQDRWSHIYPMDPFYNANLCRRAGDFRLKAI